MADGARFAQPATSPVRSVTPCARGVMDDVAGPRPLPQAGSPQTPRADRTGRSTSPQRPANPRTAPSSGVRTTPLLATPPPTARTPYANVSKPTMFSGTPRFTLNTVFSPCPSEPVTPLISPHKPRNRGTPRNPIHRTPRTDRHPSRSRARAELPPCLGLHALATHP